RLGVRAAGHSAPAGIRPRTPRRRDRCCSRPRPSPAGGRARLLPARRRGIAPRAGRLGRPRAAGRGRDGLRGTTARLLAVRGRPRTGFARPCPRRAPHPDRALAGPARDRRGGRRSGGRGRLMSERAHDRLTRLLGLVPYLTRRPGTDLADVAAHFQVDEAQIVDDLELLFVTGRPGHMPDDLIEAEWEGGRVFVGNAEDVSVPVRLSPHEAGGLLLALDYLESAHEADPSTIGTVREKLRAASGGGTGGAVDVDPPRMPAGLAATVRSAMDAGTTLDIGYYVPARDELTHRTIRPRRLRLGRVWYLDAHCLTSGGERSFAVERIRAATPSSPVAEAPIPRQPAHPAAHADADDRPRSRRGGDDVGLALVLRPEAAWLADEVDVATAGGARRDDADGPGTVALELPHAGREWAVRLLGAHGRGVSHARPE